MKRVHVIISGMVQGVCYRHFARQKAVEFTVNGWIKNRMDGKVEGIFEGPDDMVETLVSWCGHGPSGASVTDVNVKEEEFRGEFKTFSIKGSW